MTLSSRPRSVLGGRPLAESSDQAKARAAAAERDRRMANRLVEIKADFSNHTDRARLHSELESAFREYGLDFVALTVAEARARIAGSDRRIPDRWP